MGYVDTLRELTDEAGVLLMVEEIRFEEPPRMIVGLVLRFEKRTLWISANPDNDTIVLGREPSCPKPLAELLQSLIPSLGRTFTALLVAGLGCSSTSKATRMASAYNLLPHQP